MEWDRRTTRIDDRYVNDAGDVLAVMGPLGEPITLDDLPPAGVRWVVRRKAELLACIDGGLLSEADACARYSLTKEELDTWRLLVQRFGLKGLRITRTQHYRAG